MNKRIALLLFTLSMPVSLWAAEIDGRVDWAQRITLGTPVSGVIAEVNAQPGQRVKQDDVLLKLDSTNFTARVRRAKAELNKTRYALAEEERQWERAQELYERTVTSDRQLKVSEIAYQTAKANHSSASAELSMANKALADSSIRAPFDSVVIERHVNPAETVVTKLQHVPMITLGMTGRYHAVGSVDEETAAKLKNGMPVEVEVDGKTTKAEIVYVAVEPSFGGSKVISADNNRYIIKAEFASGELLRIGIPVTIILP